MENFVKSETDKFSIEHVYPQTANNDYWVTRYCGFTAEQQNCLLGSLGNLLPLSSSINASLQNDSFLDKKLLKIDDKNRVMRNGFSNGSYSELEVAEEDEWTAEQIKKRGLSLLAFLEHRWKIDLGSDENKLKLLHISFLTEC